MELYRLLDPAARFIFLLVDGLTHAFPIVNVTGNHLYFTSKEELPERFESGYFLAPQDSGIVQFNHPAVESVRNLARLKLNAPLHRIDFTTLDFSVTNRRLYQRHALKGVIPMVFQVFGETLNARLVNISAGGLRMSVDNPIKKNIRCHFEIKLRQAGEDILFKTDGLIVYADPEDNAGEIPVMVGVSFVTPENLSDTERQKYKESWQRLDLAIQALAAGPAPVP
jgi:hypothetical protein